MTDFISFSRACGMLIKDLRSGDRIFRCPTETHPKSDNGAYFFDGERGWCQNWETGEPLQWWEAKNTTPWTEAEKREWMSRRRSADAYRQKLAQQAVTKAAGMIKAARMDNHPYLKYKSHPEAKALVQEDESLLIPMRDFRDNALLGAQVIKLVDNDWQKKMIYGMRAKGAAFRLGSQKPHETYFVEGYATGLSVDTALRLSHINASVLVCFSASNLQHIAMNTTGRRYIFADHDASQTGENAAKATGLPYCMSEVVGEDANDLHARAGVFAVAKKIMEVRRH